VAYRINVGGGIVQIKQGHSKYSSFKDSDYVAFLLKTRELKVIKLNDGRRMVVRTISLMQETEELYNEKATKLLHEQSNQKGAVIHGPVIVVYPNDWKI
jgi:hypothetical protein